MNALERRRSASFLHDQGDELRHRSATRQSRTVPFGALGPVAVASTVNDEAIPWVLPDSSQVLSDAETSDIAYHIFVSTLQGDSCNSDPTHELVTAKGEGAPTVTSDGLTIYFSTERPDGGDKGGRRHLESSPEQQDATPFARSRM